MLLRLPDQPSPEFFIDGFNETNNRVQHRLGRQEDKPDEEAPESYFNQRGYYRQNN